MVSEGRGDQTTGNISSDYCKSSKHIQVERHFWSSAKWSFTLWSIIWISRTWKTMSFRGYTLNNTTNTWVHLVEWEAWICLWVCQKVQGSPPDHVRCGHSVRAGRSWCDRSRRCLVCNLSVQQQNRGSSKRWSWAPLQRKETSIWDNVIEVQSAAFILIF